MFERYTEKARRVIFFARYEASHYGSPHIETEHLLLGLLRECKEVVRWIPDLNAEAIRTKIDAATLKAPSTSTSLDLPLSSDSKRALGFASNEADRLAHRQIGTEHLLLGLLHVEGCIAAQLLREAGADADKMRKRLATEYRESSSVFERGGLSLRTTRFAAIDMVEIHGLRRNADYIRGVVNTIRAYNWHWHKADWRPQDVVIYHKDGKISLDLILAEDKENFTLVKQGWKKDHCFVCRWELFESDGEHGVGYTNGRTWLCVECCERFVLGPDFFSSSQEEMT